MYSIGAIPCDVFASRLEARWSDWLRRQKWTAVYLGDRCRLCDWLLLPQGAVPIPLECKPPGLEFVQSGARRLREGGVPEALLVSDSPSYASWYYLGANRLRRVLAPDWHSRGPGGLAGFVANLRRPPSGGGSP
jgi:hypothetical protein